jgi:hypothetical protein
VTSVYGLGATDRHCIGVVDQEVAGNQRVNDAGGNDEEAGQDQHRADDQQSAWTLYLYPMSQGGSTALRDQEREDGEGEDLESHVGYKSSFPGNAI